MNTYTGKLRVLAAAVGMAMLAGHQAMATMETFHVVNQDATNDSGYKVNSSITFNLTAGQVQITFNNTSLMHAAGELLKGVSFGISGVTNTPSISGISGDTEMPSSGSYSYSTITSNSSLSKPWDTNITSGLYYLFGSGGKNLVISAPPYPDANSSVFNMIPWLQTGVAFTLSISGVTASSTIPTNSVTFYYGTNGDSAPSVGDYELTASPAPEPASLGLMALGGMALLMKKRKKTCATG